MSSARRDDHPKSPLKDGIGFFSLFKTNQLCYLKEVNALENRLKQPIELHGYDDYIQKIKLTDFFAPTNLAIHKIMETFAAIGDVNCYNNYGMTILHTLLWANRYDLASRIIQAPRFQLINFHFCIPYGLQPIRCTALELAIEKWLDPQHGVPFKLIQQLLAYGALAPEPDQCFFNSTFSAVFYPAIICNHAKRRSQHDIAKLLSLLYQYGFSINDMENFFRDYYFPDDETKTPALAISIEYGISPARQLLIFDDFMARLNAYITTLDPLPIMVPMTQLRLATGLHLSKTIAIRPENRCQLM